MLPSDNPPIRRKLRRPNGRLRERESVSSGIIRSPASVPFSVPRPLNKWCAIRPNPFALPGAAKPIVHDRRFYLANMGSPASPRESR